MTVTSLRGRLTKLARRMELVCFDRCEVCSGPLHYEAAAVIVRRSSDGEEEILGDYCESCWQPIDEEGRGKGWPIPGRPDEPRARTLVIIEPSPEGFVFEDEYASKAGPH